MRPDPVASRYAQALFDLAKAHGQVEAVLDHLTQVGGACDTVPALRQLMGDPGVRADDKLELLKRALQGVSSPLAEAFVRLAVSFGRAQLLGEMAEAFQAAVDADQGRMRAVVRSARPLPEGAVRHLRRTLETLEGKIIELSAELDETLLGGLQVFLGSRVIDHSVRRQLDDLHQHLKTVRVN